MNPKDITKQNIDSVNLMQLATSQDDEPWVCTVHFYADDDFNLYWISNENRHHSQQIVANPNVAATILVHENIEGEDWVTAITIAGTGELMDQVDEGVGKAYIAKLNKDPAEVESASSGTGPAKFYRLKPSKIILFDTKNFPDQPRQELELGVEPVV